MDAAVGGLLVLLLVLGFGPSVRGVAAGIDSIENPSRQETPEERDRANSDMLRLLVLLIAVFGLMFVWKLGG